MINYRLDRYTTLVRRNFLRFGKRSGAPPGPEGMADAERNKFDSDYDSTFEDLVRVPNLFSPFN